MIVFRLPIINFFLRGLLALWLFTAALAPRSSVAEDTAKAVEANIDAKVDFARDIAPLLTRNCIACHNAKKLEGGLNLESHAGVMAGGDSGPAIVPMNTDAGELLSRVVDADDPMPPLDNTVGAAPLNADEVELLRRWVTQGAVGSNATSNSTMAWQAIPVALSPIYALDSSRDGELLAVGHGNTVQLVRPVGSHSSAQPRDLIDANLQLPDGAPLAATHLDLVQSLAFSPDSQTLATGGFRTVKLWRRQTAAQQVLSGLATSDGPSAFSPSGARLAVVAQGTGIDLVDVAGSQSHRLLGAHAQPVTALVWLSDQTLLTADSGGGWSLTLASTNATAPLKYEGQPHHATQIVRVGQRLFALDDAGALFELQLASGLPFTEAVVGADDLLKLRPMTLPAAGSLLAAVTLPEPSLLVTLKNQKLVRVGLEEAAVLTEWPYESEPLQILASTNGESLLTVSTDGTARLLKLASGELLATLDQDYIQATKFRESQRDVARQRAYVDQLVAQLPELQKASEAEVEAHKKVQEMREQALAALTAKDTELATAQASRAETEQALAAAQKRVTELTAELEAKQKAVQDVETKRTAAASDLADRDQALATAADGVQRAAERITALQSLTDAERKRFDEVQAHSTELQNSVSPPPALTGQFSPDGSAVVVAGSDHALRIYATATGAPRANLTGATVKVLSMASMDDHTLRGLTADGRILSWNLSLPWKLEQTIGSAAEAIFSDRICALDFSPDGSLLAVGSGPPSRFGDIKLIDLPTGSIARDFGEVHSDTVLSLRFSPDGRRLASGGADKLCRLWDVATGEALRSFEGHTHHVLGVAWQDNGQRLATASADHSVKIWKVDSGEQLRTIAGFNHEVTAIEFVGDTPQLVAVAADGSARILNADDGATLRALAGAENALYTLSISADTLRISAAGQAGKVWTWQIADGKLLE